MNTSYESFQKRRLRTSYFSVIISIALVLFMLGILGLVVLQSQKVANHFREEIEISLKLKDDANQQELDAFREDILRENYVKNLEYISKEEAAKEIGDDINVLGFNPLKNQFLLHLNAEFVTPQKMKELENRFDKETFIYEVDYNKVLVEKLDENIEKISFWILVVSAVFGFMAILLMNSSIRLSIYSKRFNIKTMQMVGATKSFIRRPFIVQGLKLGFIGAFLALCALGALVYYVDYHIPTFGLLEDYMILIYVALGVISVAFLITWLSTFFAAQRFLNLNTNDLYE